MSTSVQSENSQPSARDLLTLLKGLSEADLDKPIGYWDEQYADYTDWGGKLEIGDSVCLSYAPSDAVQAELARIAAERERQRQEQRAQDPVETDHREEVRRAREAGLLPDGA